MLNHHGRSTHTIVDEGVKSWADIPEEYLPGDCKLFGHEDHGCGRILCHHQGYPIILMWNGDRISYFECPPELHSSNRGNKKSC